MAERYSREQLEEFGKKIFAENPHIKVLFGTEDGNFFSERSKSDATNYARQTQQELVIIERVKHEAFATVAADSDDPLARDVAAIMLALDCTEDKARELIAQHKGNAAAAVQTAKQPETPVDAAPAAKKTRKSSTSKKTSNESAQS